MQKAAGVTTGGLSRQNGRDQVRDAGLRLRTI